VAWVSGSGFSVVCAAFSAKLLAILPHDRRSRFQPNADTAPVIDIGAFSSNPPDDFLSRQNRCHDAAILVRSLASIRTGPKAHSFRT
jgi:hypothetical protein